LNLDVIESAVGRPYTGYYPKLWQKAGAIAQSVAGNHGFTDGNKRTALYLLLLLMDRSGYWLQPLTGEDIQIAITDLLVRIAERKIEIDEITEWFRLRLIRVKKH
jgi:death on curing protein